jgi:membrane-associated phospholipid phosphatase
MRHRIHLPVTWRFHVLMALACGCLFLLGTAYSLAHHLPLDIGPNIVLIVITTAVISPLALYYLDRNQPDRMDAALTIPWGVTFGLCIISIVGASARLHFPLRDMNYGALDSMLGVSIPAIREWSLHHQAGKVANASYPFLNWFLLSAFLVPALAGRATAARVFLFANVIAFAISIPIFTLWPAIGPWYAFHTAASPAQLGLQSEILGLHNGTSQAMNVAGLVCFPSFHVIWAILAAWALSTFRPMRIPAAILCTLIICSTVTTGWHYFCDVLSGGIIGVVSLLAARALDIGLRRKAAENSRKKLTTRTQCAVS